MDKLLATAADQLGLFTRAQAHACNVSDGMLRRRVANGTLVALSHRVFQVAGAPDTWPARVLAACLGAPCEVAASHRTAAALEGIGRWRALEPEPIELTVPHGTRYEWPNVVVHQSRSFGEVDRCEVNGVPVTTVARTLIDLGAVVRFGPVEDAVDAAERDGLVGRYELDDRFRTLRASGRNGVATMRLVLRAREDVPESVLERRFLRLLQRAHLPPPALQHPVEIPGGRVFRIDAAYVPHLLGFELDGHRWHAARGQRRADNKRLGVLANLGWDIRRFTYEQVVDDGLAVVEEVRAALVHHGFGAPR